MSRIHQSLIRKLKNLPPSDVARVEAYVRQLRDQPVSEAADTPIAAGELDTATASEASTGRSHRAANADFVGDGPWNLWLRRPFDAVCDNDLEPIRSLFRAAVEQRTTTRLRFGASR